MNHLNGLGKINISIYHKRYEDMNHMNELRKKIFFENRRYEDMNHLNGLGKINIS